MEYVTNIKDFVIQVLTNGSEIKSKAEKGDALSCFQMGMINMLGINTQIDFKKASRYFGNQLLKDDPDANRFLGFIAECEGNYSLAFKNYANATDTTGSNAKKPYINKVYTERNNLQAYLKKFELPSTVLNKQITEVLNDCIKGGDSKVDAAIKLAMICDDEESCFEAAQALFDEGDYYSAMRWLQNGNVSENNALYASVKNKISDSKSVLNLPNVLEVIEIEGNSFLSNLDATPSYVRFKELCDKEAVLCKKDWYDKVSLKITTIKKRVEDEEAARIKKQKEEEAARKKKQKEAERKALLKQQAEEEEQKKKRKENISNGFIFAILLICIGGVYYIYSNFNGWLFIVLTIVCIFVSLILIGMIAPDDKKK